jgi:ribosomal protein S27E
MSVLTDAIEIVHPSLDSHFRLLPCKVCRGEDVVYVQYQAGELSPWRVQCLTCGHAVDKHTEVRHEVQVAWNEEVVA